MNTIGPRRFAQTALAALLIALAAWGNPAGVLAQERIPVVKSKTTTYTNVTITARTETELCILHDGGAGNVTFEDLEPEAYTAVGYVPPQPASEKLKNLASEQAAKVMQVWKAVPGNGESTVPRTLPLTELDPTVLVILGVVGFFCYLFFCYCYMLICRKSGDNPGLLIWIPILQIFPLLRAAKMSCWWVLGMLLPILNIIIPIVWCFKIASARGKSPVWGIFLILPITNLIALLYLAFSAGDDADAPPPGPTRLGTLAIRPI